MGGGRREAEKIEVFGWKWGRGWKGVGLVSVVVLFRGDSGSSILLVCGYWIRHFPLFPRLINVVDEVSIVHTV